MGYIIITNQGQLIIKNSDFELNDNLTIANNGIFKISQSNLTIHQEYIFEHTALLIGKTKIIFNNVNF